MPATGSRFRLESGRRGEREPEILGLLLDGLSHEEIAAGHSGTNDTRSAAEGVGRHRDRGGSDRGSGKPRMPDPGMKLHADDWRVDRLGGRRGDG
jgi:hypothetical protein